MHKTPYLRESGTGGGEAASPRAEAGFVARHSERQTMRDQAVSSCVCLCLPICCDGGEGQPTCVQNELIETDRSQLFGICSSEHPDSPVFLQSEDESSTQSLAWLQCVYPSCPCWHHVGSQGSPSGGTYTLRVVLGSRRRMES